MDQQRYDKGLAIRKEVLGAEYVDTALANAGEFAGEFQELLTEYCWGGVWGDETLPRKTRSMLNLTMLAALNRMHEWGLHFRGAINNGVSRDELRALDADVVVPQIQRFQWGADQTVKKRAAGGNPLVRGFWASDGGAD